MSKTTEYVIEDRQPYSDLIRREEVEGLADDIELDGKIRIKFIKELMDKTKNKDWDLFYDIADDVMEKY
jgi:hypothetical protein